MPKADNLYTRMRNLARARTGNTSATDYFLAAAPPSLTPEDISQFQLKYNIIREYQKKVRELFFDSLCSNAPPCVANWFLSGTPAGFGLEYHKSIPQNAVNLPIFFRTDEMRGGLISEIQAPGSGWGDYTLIEDTINSVSCITGTRLPESFNRAVLKILPRDAVIHHFLDNASSISSNYYFIARSREESFAPRYWGFDEDVRPQDCNFIRTHLSFSLLSENFAQQRMIRWVQGLLWYDHPPLCIFEQKCAMALPFHPETRVYFSDNERDLFPFTSIILPDQILLPDGARLTHAAFVSLQRQKRNYFIKYGGIDPERNWGSRAVFHAGEASKEKLKALLAVISADFESKRGVWILQASVETKSGIEYIDRDENIAFLSGYEKLSGFYGPTGLMGILAMYRRKKKVHGQPDTVMSIL